jgi:hypothetical protein
MFSPSIVDNKNQYSNPAISCYIKFISNSNFLDEITQFFSNLLIVTHIHLELSQERLVHINFCRLVKSGFGSFYRKPFDRKTFDRKPLYRNGHLTETSFDRNIV